MLSRSTSNRKSSNNSINNANSSNSSSNSSSSSSNNNNNYLYNYSLSLRSLRDIISDQLLMLVNQFAMPWFEECIRKYGEEEFHRRMHSSWDLYEDWQQHHYNKYWQWINKARKVRRFIKWDSKKFTDKIVELLRAKGWHVDDFEYQKIYNTVKKVERDIMS